ncbi:ABC transporter ATP-binding protein [Streptomyces marispadix]|uniref:ATP-binding cassette domain-containing protein n=1 Tax=Streptomyces marispadix TaxID=2922868 RepID=A0ABS9T5K4_9ACTN|nr:ATP-binding cassette domain-containing protein [Streptomyces marispadix]MCH6163780.1 ATP-binding cassette domain-containing protein [Streptomyces marispadix]
MTWTARPRSGTARAPGAESAGTVNGARATDSQAAAGQREVENAVVHARGLTKSYPGHDAVQGVDLTVRAGEIFGFLGPNGAGKSTTISMLCTLTPPTGGRAVVAGADIRTRPRLVRARVGALFQHSALEPDLSAARNLYLRARLHGLPRRTARVRTARALETAGLADRADERVRTLSGGLRRRLDIAHVLLHAPRLLFLDEPTVGLDPPARAQLWQHLRSLRAREGMAVFVTTHYLDEAEHCDRLAIIDHGRIVAEDSPERLKSRLGRESVRLRTDDDSRTSDVLREELQLAAGHGPDGLLTVPVTDAGASLPRLCSLLSARGVRVHEATSATPTLDDVFMHHTGRRFD